MANGVTPNECYIHNAGNIQLGRRTCIHSAYPVLGEILMFQPPVRSEMYIPLHAICEQGSIWLATLDYGATPDTFAEIDRVIWTKKNIYTTKGIHIGDPIQKVYDAYGYPTISTPNRLHEYNGIVSHWDTYDSSTHGLIHMGFGSRNGYVTAIYVSRMAGGL
jgi:hypothetical protein